MPSTVTSGMSTMVDDILGDACLVLLFSSLALLCISEVLKQLRKSDNPGGLQYRVEKLAGCLFCLMVVVQGLMLCIKGLCDPVSDKWQLILGCTGILVGTGCFCCGFFRPLRKSQATPPPSTK